ncbi:MAG TPA: hypothetical protein VGJ16_05990 [Pirellulales bacterium]|jgi:hypothetical protein
MWTSSSESLSNSRVLKFAIHLENNPVTYADVLRRWHGDREFRSFFGGLLANSPFSAFRFETPSVTSDTANRPFEFVLLDSPGLARTPDSHAFAEHFRRSGQAEAIEFCNLGMDAIMVVPCPLGPPSSYSHLGAFVREAPESQKHALWELVGVVMQRRLGSKPVWLSTAGAGVSWLHVRLDDRPKYYGYAPYRHALVAPAIPARRST